MAKVIRGCTHNPVTLQVVAQADGNHLRNQRVFLERIDRCQGNIARRYIQVQDAGQNQLHRATLSPHHRVDSGQVTVKSTLYMVRH